MTNDPKPLTVREIQRERRKSYRDVTPKKCCKTCRFFFVHHVCILLWGRSKTDAFYTPATGLCSFWKAEEK
jgi:hypothetical protein